MKIFQQKILVMKRRKMSLVINLTQNLHKTKSKINKKDMRIKMKAIFIINKDFSNQVPNLRNYQI
jgi:hypothetical protein